MLPSCGATLRSLTLTICDDFGEPPEYFTTRCHLKVLSESLERAMRWLSRLSSLTLVVVPFFLKVQQFSENIRSATRVLKSVERTHLIDVQVEFYNWSGTIASLGSILSGPDAPSLDDCKLLEETLLAFPNPRILVNDDASADNAWRTRTLATVRRAEFWLPAVELAFPTLNKQGFRLLSFTRCES